MPVKDKKIPERSCVGCGKPFPKNELIRVVRAPSGSIAIDMTGKMSGRGAYICRASECFKKARKAKRLERALNTSISDEIYDNLQAQVSDNEK